MFRLRRTLLAVQTRTCLKMAAKKSSFTGDEIAKLLELYQENSDCLLSSLKSTVTNQHKKKMWNFITDEVNKIGGNNRLTKETIHKWKDLKSRAKKDISARKNPKTGGGKPPKEGS